MKIANVEMAAAWDGEEGDDWTENAARYEATDRWISARFEAECPIASTDRVLDIGCGTGKSTRAAARRAAAGSVLGIDLSSRMLEYAREQTRAGGSPTSSTCEPTPRCTSSTPPPSTWR